MQCGPRRQVADVERRHNDVQGRRDDSNDFTRHIARTNRIRNASWRVMTSCRLVASTVLSRWPEKRMRWAL